MTAATKPIATTGRILCLTRSSSPLMQRQDHGRSAVFSNASHPEGRRERHEAGQLGGDGWMKQIEARGARVPTMRRGEWSSGGGRQAEWLGIHGHEGRPCGPTKDLEGAPMRPTGPIVKAPGGARSHATVAIRSTSVLSVPADVPGGDPSRIQILRRTIC
jgi:hypothetical protein